MLILLSCALGLAMVEIMLRTLAPTSEVYRIWPPFLQRNFFPDEARFPGVRGEARFRINSQGLRADELIQKHDFQVLAVGGSTTECLILDQNEAWPNLLQQYLDASWEVHNSWVGNAGRSGHSSREHLFQVPRLLEEYPQLDLMVILVGVNDLGLRLKLDDNYDPYMLESEGIEEIMLPRAFSQFPLKYRKDLPFYKRTELYNRARTIKNFLFSQFFSSDQIQDAEFHVYDRWRQLRKNARRIIKELPDLSAALDEYRRNLERIVSYAEEKGVKVLLVTQPSMWRSDLSAADRDLLWWGGIGDYRKDANDRDYYSVSALADGMEQYNQVLLDLCHERHTECLDLARLLPRDRSVFVDGVHFNENGARLVARQIADRIIDNPED